MVESIAKTLGTGSGIDTTSLVQQLVDAQFANKNAALTKKSDTLSTQISGVAALKSGISGFSSALSTLVKSGSLMTQPTSGSPDIATVTALPGAKLQGLDARLEVRQLAAAQVASTATVADPTAPIGTGTLTLSFGAASVSSGAMDSFTAGADAPIDIAIDADHASLQGIADAINAAKAGVTASILTDSDGSRLVLKGPTGAAKAFTLSATEDAGAPGLSSLDIGVGAAGTTIGTGAADAIVALDGVVVKRTSNTIEDLIPGVRFSLMSAKPGTEVKIGANAPTASLQQVVSDVVDTYNQVLAVLKTQLDPVTGPLRGDTAARALQQALSHLTLSPLAAGNGDGAPTTLSALGVATARDGTLSVDAAALTRALTRYPDAVEAMFADGAGLPKLLGTIATAATSTASGLGASAARYGAQQGDLARDQSDLADAASKMQTRMTQQFAAMDAKVAAYKSTQTFLQSQIDAWNASKN